MAVNVHKKKNVEPHQNLIGSYEKSLEVLDEIQNTQYRKIKS